MGTGTPVIEKFKAKYMVSTIKFWNGTPCWEWTGFIDPDGYGMFWVNNNLSPQRAHRFSYEHHVGPIPAGLQIDHLCRVRNCINPEHLEPVTSRENSIRGKAMITHCPHGHPYAGKNLYLKDGYKRSCRECQKIRMRQRLALNPELIRERKRKYYARDIEASRQYVRNKQRARRARIKQEQAG